MLKRYIASILLLNQLTSHQMLILSPHIFLLYYVKYVICRYQWKED